MSAIEAAVEKLGGVVATSTICKVTPQAVRKWITRRRLPRTEYTGETQHAQRMAEASGGAFTAEWLLEHAGPSSSVAAYKVTPEPVTPSDVEQA